ncbi:MAG: hypothetical protein R2788_20495 [Saprospiraceae bacterium]
MRSRKSRSFGNARKCLKEEGGALPVNRRRPLKPRWAEQSHASAHVNRPAHLQGKN